MNWRLAWHYKQGETQQSAIVQAEGLCTELTSQSGVVYRMNKLP
jgi:hypothetical protein